MCQGDSPGTGQDRGRAHQHQSKESQARPSQGDDTVQDLGGKDGSDLSANELFPDDSPEGGGEVEELRSRHREHMEAVQSLWKE